jgi:hypothetical protein
MNTFESRPVTNKKEDGSDERLASQIFFEYGKLILMYNIGKTAIVKIAKNMVLFNK